MADENSTDWAKIDLEGLMRQLGEVTPQCPDGSPQSRAVEVGTYAVYFLLDDVFRAWFLRHVQSRQGRRPLFPYENAKAKHIAAEQEQERADLEAYTEKDDESVDLGEVLQQLKRLALPYPGDSPVSKAIGVVVEAVASVNEEATRRRFIKFLQRRVGPPKEYEVEFHNFMMGEPKPADDEATRSQDKP